MPQSDSPVSSLPMENSPPGIQTIPSGARVGAAMGLGTVGPKFGFAVAGFSTGRASAAGGGALRGGVTMNTTTPEAMITPAATQGVHFFLVVPRVRGWGAIFLRLLMGRSFSSRPSC